MTEHPRILRAVKPCPTCKDRRRQAPFYDHNASPCTPPCSDGWVEVPVTAQCACFVGGIMEAPMTGCPLCGGSGEAPAAWAIWLIGDPCLWEGYVRASRAVRLWQQIVMTAVYVVMVLTLLVTFILAQIEKRKRAKAGSGDE